MKKKKSDRINDQLERAAKVVEQLPQWMKDIEAQRQKAWEEEQNREEE